MNSYGMNRQMRRQHARKPIPTERTPTTNNPQLQHVMNALGIPPRPTPEAVDSVLRYITWLLGSTMPAIRAIVDEHMKLEKHDRTEQMRPYVVAIWVMLSTLPGAKGDEIEAAIKDVFGGSQ